MNQKILFVDDEPAALNCYRQMLQSEFDIATAATGEEGLVSLRNNGPFAIVISDMQMVGMDGVQFLKRVRQVAPSTMRLLLTGQVDLNGAVNAVLKRTMAGEFSRELGVKVYDGKRRLTLLGFRGGGQIPYGFRRLCISKEGKRRRLWAAVIAIIVRSAIKLVRTTLGKHWLLWAIFGLIALTRAWTKSEIAWLFAQPSLRAESG